MQIQHKFHHDARPYEVASKESADKARARLQVRFDQGRVQIENTLNKVMSEVPMDYLVPSSKVNFDWKGNKLQGSVTTKDGPAAFTLHDHAYGQVLEKAGIPKVYADRLTKDGQYDLLQSNIQTRYQRQDKDTKYLVRAVNGEIRGWLSDSFGRYDCKPLLEAFAYACKAVGAVPVEARHLDTRVYVKMLLPFIFEPIPNEVMALGIQFKDSDVGDGAYSIRAFWERVWCTNDAVAEESLRQVHIGAKMTEANFSIETVNKKTELLASVTKDTVMSTLSEANVLRQLEVIKLSAEKNIPIKTTLESLRKKGGRLTLEECERVQEILTVADVELMPAVTKLPEPGQTSAYRLANAFGLLAKDEKISGVRAMELENLAGEIIGFKRTGAKIEDVVIDVGAE